MFCGDRQNNAKNYPGNKEKVLSECMLSRALSQEFSQKNSLERPSWPRWTDGRQIIDIEREVYLFTHLCIDSFIHSFLQKSMDLLPYPGTVVGAGDAVMPKTRSVPSRGS